MKSIKEYTPHEKLRLFVAMFIVLIFAVVTFFGMTGQTGGFICPDGSVVAEESLCIQCQINTDCNLDQTCSNEGRCEAVQCVLDTDCRIPGNICSFGRCGPEFGLDDSVV